MAVDRKSQHVGNHGGAYTDNDGMSRQFTMIDHDKKPTFAIKQVGEINLSKELQQYRGELIVRITDLPPSICNDIFYDYTLRGEGRTVIEWNIPMLSDKGVPLSQLRDMCILLENKADVMKLIH